MDKDLYAEIQNEVQDRTDWEKRQATWYELRYNGIKRASKPYKNAPDMHYPLVDTFIEKVKPFYLQQLYSQERLAAFVSGKSQLQDVTTMSEKLFDYTMKQRTNFERSVFTAIDYMLMYGHGPMKFFWSASKNQLVFRPIRPIYIVVPSYTEELGDAEWLVHIIHMSPAEYKRQKGYKQDESFIKSITGAGNPTSGQKEQEDKIKRRKGINIGLNNDMITLWEVFYRDNKGEVKVALISPIAGPDKPVRAERGLPYKGNKFPFADLRYEIADTDFLSSRGVTEILHQFELDLCKMWNHKLQFLDFFGQPSYKNSGISAVSPSNFQNSPGKVLPPGLLPNEVANAPLDFEKEMQLQRALAEDRVQIPDLSAGQHLVGERGAKGGITARQIDAIVNQSGVGNDMRARFFRSQLATIYQQAWSIMCEKLPSDQMVLQDYTQVSKDAMHADYRVSPSGSSDGLSKEQRLAKALSYMQQFRGDPSIKQNELTKWTLEQDDAELVARLYQEPEDANQTEAERQANEIVLMTYGFPPEVKPADNDSVHLVTIDKFLEHASQTQQPLNPPLAALLLQHCIQHASAIEAKKDKQGKMMVQQLKPMFQYLGQIAQGGSNGSPAGQPAAGGMTGGPSGPGAPPSGPAQEQEAPASARESISISYKDAPPSVQRQMEMAAGFQPAQPAEAAAHYAMNSKIVQQAAKPQPPKPQLKPPTTVSK